MAYVAYVAMVANVAYVASATSGFNSAYVAYVAMVAYATSGFTPDTSGIRHQVASGCINIRFLRRCRMFIHQLNLVNEMLNFVSSAFLARLTAKSVPNCANNC